MLSDSQQRYFNGSVQNNGLSVFNVCKYVFSRRAHDVGSDRVYIPYLDLERVSI